jgi:hypothetical protein
LSGKFRVRALWRRKLIFSVGKDRPTREACHSSPEKATKLRRFDLHGRIPDLAILPTISGRAIRVRHPTILGHRKKLLSMTSEVMDSNFPLSDTADIANDR